MVPLGRVTRPSAGNYKPPSEVRSAADLPPATLAELRGNGFVSAVLKKYGLSDRNLFWFKLNP